MVDSVDAPRFTKQRRKGGGKSNRQEPRDTHTGCIINRLIKMFVIDAQW